MEDYEAQEVEFWAKLEEEGMSRSAMLRRSVAAAAGITILGSASTALGMSRMRASGSPPLKGSLISMKELVAQAKKEGHLNTIALPNGWADYQNILPTFTKKYGIPITNASPQASSGDEIQAVITLKGQGRAPDAVDVGPGFAVQGANSGLFAKYFVKTYKTIPRNMKDTRGYWTGDYWGAIAFGANLSVVKRAPTSWKDLLSPDFSGHKVALNDDPRKANAAFSGVFAAALANGGSLDDITPGVDFFAKLAKAGNFQPINVTPQTVASGQTPVTIDWDYNQLSAKTGFPNINWKVTLPKDGLYGGYYCQAINATAPHPWAVRLWQEFLFSDQGQLMFLAGYSHPARFADLLARKVVPKKLLAALPPAAFYAQVKFAGLGQIAKAKAIVAEQWGPKVLGG
jgi:putative spermidine/putrescine transport system substrate-binding protein